MKFKGFLIGAGAALIVAGCAPSAQNVKLEPQVDVEERFAEERPEVALRVKDRRSQQILGYRDPGRGITLGIEGSLADVVRESLRDALERQGVVVKEWDGEAENRLTVDIKSFEYERSGGFLRRQVDLETMWEVKGSFEGTRVSSQARARTSERMLTVPGDAKNEELVNTILNRAIHQVVTNDELLEQLREVKD
ncbi:YajG family lipoprotein [Halorhodospira halochloris]|uniref:YajG family lipoprotein n=1 Tax=Halorhodospira halochloris TaxID=1052 RepID=UPI001EE9901D|nr:YajG family lipoprotein [Halorhodospira halochloris]MCG5529958.1 YajG family lipoprotein [Halorhodospira halochloris]